MIRDFMPGIVAFVAALILAFLATAGVPNNPEIAHQYADSILAPEFQAAYNRFRAEHPSDKKPGEWDHVKGRHDAGDAERWAAVLERFEALKKAMKTAGY